MPERRSGVSYRYTGVFKLTSCVLVTLSLNNKIHKFFVKIIISPPFLHPQLNPDVNVFQRKFVNEVRRCGEMDRKLSKL